MDPQVLGEGGGSDGQWSLGYPIRSGGGVAAAPLPDLSHLLHEGFEFPWFLVLCSPREGWKGAEGEGEEARSDVRVRILC